MNFPEEKEFFLLPVVPDDGFPQVFTLAFAGQQYRFTFRVSFLTLEPFKIWKAGSTASTRSLLQRSFNLPLNTAGARPPLPAEVPGEPERMLYVLPQEQLYLVMQVEREGLPTEQRLQGITRPVLGIPFRVGDLQFLFKKISIARGNLLGSGNFGSEIHAGVKLYNG